jgi:branched-chain amino acid transport system substrate-binding protein
VTTLQFDSNSKDTVVEKFVHDFTAKYNEVPDIYAAAGYDCMDVIADAMKKIEGDVTADSVKYYFDHMTEIHGVTGAIMFDAKGEVQKNYTVYVVQNGAFVRFN